MNTAEEVADPISYYEPVITNDWQASVAPAKSPIFLGQEPTALATASIAIFILATFGALATRKYNLGRSATYEILRAIAAVALLSAAALALYAGFYGDK